MKKKKESSYEMTENATQIVREPAIAYGSYYEAPANNTFFRIELARKGITKKMLLDLAQKMEISISEMANILQISLRTIQRYEDSDRFDTRTSEHILLIERLYKFGYNSIFDSPHSFNEWMKREQFGLQYLVPVSLLDTFSGIELVYSKLVQFEHGVFA